MRDREDYLRIVLNYVKEIPGPISLMELAVMFNVIQDEYQVEQEVIAMDLGSHCGKSSCVASAAFSYAGHEVDCFYCIDPLYDKTNYAAWTTSLLQHPDHNPWEHTKGDDFNSKVQDTVGKFSCLNLTLIGDDSIRILNNMNTPIGHIFVDSDDHQSERVMKEVQLLSSKVSHGGLVFFHDFKNGGYIGPEAGYNWLLGTGLYDPIPLEPYFKRAIETYDPDGFLEERNNSWHKTHDNPHPQYLGCVRRKK